MKGLPPGPGTTTDSGFRGSLGCRFRQRAGSKGSGELQFLYSRFLLLIMQRKLSEFRDPFQPHRDLHCMKGCPVVPVVLLCAVRVDMAEDCCALRVGREFTLEFNPTIVGFPNPALLHSKSNLFGRMLHCSHTALARQVVGPSTLWLCQQSMSCRCCFD